MEVDERSGGRDKAERPPDAFPETPPPQFTTGVGHSRCSWSYRVPSAELSRSVETLTEQSKEHDKKLNQISHRIYAAVAVLTIFGAVLLWILNTVSDEIVTVVKEALLR